MSDAPTTPDVVRFDMMLPRDLRDKAMSAARASGLTTLAPYLRQALIEKLRAEQADPGNNLHYSAARDSRPDRLPAAARHAPPAARAGSRPSLRQG